MIAARTALYVPGDRPDRFGKAAAAGADTVILDLEDAVSPARKELALRSVVEWLASPAAVGVDVQVRINHPSTPWAAVELAMLPAGVGLRLPRVESTNEIDEAVAGGPRAIHVLIETAAGLEDIRSIARHRAVATIGLGEADLSADLGIGDESALTWARSALVVAARAAGLPAPMMSAYTSTTDLSGLAASCSLGRRLGMRGRAAVHPRQLPVITAAFAPTASEIAWAHDVLELLGNGTGVAVLADGSMVDEAMARRARAWLAQLPAEAGGHQP